MLYRITFDNRDAVAESEDDGKSWVIRTGYSTCYFPKSNGVYETPFGRTKDVTEALELCGYTIKSIVVGDGYNVFGFKAAEGRWEVIRKEGDTKKIVGYIYETGEPLLCYRYESADKKKEILSNSLMRLLAKLKPREWK